MSIAAGILGIVAGFINAIDRYLDYNTKAELHKKNSVLFATLPEIHALTRTVKRIIDEELNEITDAKFEAHSNDDMTKARKLISRSYHRATDIESDIESGDN